MNEETKPGKPYANSAIARYLDKQIDALRGQKTQREIASEIGYDKPNMISMFKRGEVKVPLDKIAPLAHALHVDPGHLFRLAMEQYWPKMIPMIAEIFGRTVSEREMELLIKPWREATNNADPAPNDRIRLGIKNGIEIALH